MPQMMPLNWLILFMFFSMLLLMFNTMNYYIFNNNNLNMKPNSKMIYNTSYWKW